MTSTRPFEFPDLPAVAWGTSLATLFDYARALGAIRRATTPRQKHWSHLSLSVSTRGLRTPPIPAGRDLFELQLDLTAHAARMATSRGVSWETRLRGQAPGEFWDELGAGLAACGLSTEAKRPDGSEASKGYEPAHVEAYWRTLSQIAILMERLRGELREETSAVQFWPHHADLALLWFSGRRVPGMDPADEDKADEQMNFGFSPPDTSVSEPYFYVTAYPLPDRWVGGALPRGAEWHTAGWNGAVLCYRELVHAENPDELLQEFWRTTRAAGAARMLEALSKSTAVS